MLPSPCGSVWRRAHIHLTKHILACILEEELLTKRFLFAPARRNADSHFPSLTGSAIDQPDKSILCYEFSMLNFSLFLTFLSYPFQFFIILNSIEQSHYLLQLCYCFKMKHDNHRSKVEVILLRSNFYFVYNMTLPPTTTMMMMRSNCVDNLWFLGQHIILGFHMRWNFRNM